ncbi:MAG: divergent PAP2 family protein [Firmicutes bacterium]|nr:divergent PAP2 family protein [Bacillota bacterium]
MNIFENYTLISAVIAWFIAQVLKVILTLVTTKKFQIERMVGPGGMPSAHSASVCALTVAVLFQYGAASVEFAICFVLSTIVIYDATSVRWQAGEQAKAINKSYKKINELINGENTEPLTLEDLKEVLGHTKLEALAGAVLGTVVAIVMHFIYIGGNLY